MQRLTPQKLSFSVLRERLWRIQRRFVSSSQITRQWCGRLGGVGREVSSRIFLRVIGTPLEDRAPSLYLFSDSQRYFFNCGENIIRLLHELNMNLDARKIFLTRLAWDNMAGLPLALRFLTGPSSRNKHAHVLGPQGTSRFVESIKTFSKTLTEMALVDSTEFHGTDRSCFTDDNVTIKPIILKGSQISNVHLQAQSSICYVCELAELPGKLLKDKVEFLGIPADQRISLTLGDSVVLSNGTEVNPKDVMSSPLPGQVIFIVDCPSLETMDSLISNHDLEAYRKRHWLPVDLVVHMTPRHVLDTNSYLTWLEKFGPKTQHIILSKELCLEKDPFQQCEELQSRLHSVNPCIFPSFENTVSRSVSFLPQNCIIGKNMMTYHFRPLKIEGFEESQTCESSDFYQNHKKMIRNFRLNTVAWLPTEKKSGGSDAKQERRTVVLGTKSYDSIRSDVAHYYDESSNVTTTQSQVVSKTVQGIDLGDVNADSHLQTAAHDFKLTFLGTGASHPSTFRNNPGIILTPSDNNYLVLDCGEGFYSQLELLYGKKKAEKITANCSCIFISHIHADHHVGLVKLLLLRQKLSLSHQLSDLVIVGPKKLLTWLNKLRKCGIDRVDSNLQFKYLTFQNMDDTSFKGFLSSVGIKKFEPVPVMHCHDSHGVVLEHKDGWKLVYSGDCRPSAQLVKAGRDATLLIHDATFQNEHSHIAVTLSHSTIAEALDVGRRMQAKYTILTHFSRRYKIRSFANLRLPPNAITAWDHMVVRLSDLPTLHEIRPAISRALRKEFMHGTKRKKFLQAELERSQVSEQRTVKRERMRYNNLE